MISFLWYKDNQIPFATHKHNVHFISSFQKIYIFYCCALTLIKKKVISLPFFPERYSKENEFCSNYISFFFLVRNKLRLSLNSSFFYV